jgi:hypothetical protein
LVLNPNNRCTWAENLGRGYMSFLPIFWRVREVVNNFKGRYTFLGFVAFLLAFWEMFPEWVLLFSIPWPFTPCLHLWSIKMGFIRFVATRILLWTRENRSLQRLPDLSRFGTRRVSPSDRPKAFWSKLLLDWDASLDSVASVSSTSESMSLLLSGNCVS